MTSPISERLQFVLDAVNGGAVVGELQRIGAAGETSQTRLQQQTQRTGEAFDRQGQAGRTSLAVISDGANRSTTMLGRMSDRLGVTESTLRTGIGTAAAAGFAILIAKVAESTRQFIDSARAAGQLARSMNATTEEGGQLLGLVQTLGLDLQDLIEIQAEFAQKASPEVLASFGAELQNNADGTVNWARTLEDALANLQQVQDATERNRLGFQLFGEEGFKQLSRLLVSGVSVKDALEQIGTPFTDADIAAVQEYDAAMRDFNSVSGEAGRTLARVFLPVLTTGIELVDGFADVVGSIPGPLLQAGIASAVFSAAAIKLNGALAGIRASRAAEAASATATSMTQVAGAAGAAEGATSRLARGLSRAGVAGAALGASIPLLGELYDLLRDIFVDEPDVNRLATALEYLGNTGGTAGAFGDLGGIEGFQSSLAETLVIGEAFNNNVPDLLNIEGITRQFTQGSTEISAYDDALASLVEGGSPEAAKSAFDALVVAAAEQGVSIEQLRELFPGYTQALQDATLAEQSAAAGAEEHGAAVEGTKELVDRYARAVEDLERALDGLNGQAVTLAEADIALRDSMADLTEQVRDAIEAGDANALSLDRNTQAGRDNESALIDQIAAAEEFASAVTNQTGSVQEGEKAFLTQIGAIRQNMTALGFNAAQVDVLLGRYARVPNRVSTAVALQDYASGGLSTVESKLRNLDGKVATVTINEITRYIIASGTQKRAGGGAVAAGEDYIVGEVRPEFFRPAVPGTIVPNTGAAQTGSSTRGGDGPLMNVEQLIVRDDRDIAKVEAALAFSYATRGR